MFKFVLLALAMLSAAQAAFPHAHHVHKALLRNVEQMRGSLSLFENSGSGSSNSGSNNDAEDCARIKNGFSMDECRTLIASDPDSDMTEADCPCLVDLLPSMKPLMDLTICAGPNPECENIFEGGLNWEMCESNSCLNRLLSAFKTLTTAMQAPKCSNVPPPFNQTDIDNMEDFMDFACAKNTQGDFCGQAWTDFGQRAVTNNNCSTLECTCSEFSGLGCCSKTFVDYYGKHEPGTADAITDIFNDTCGFDLSTMPTCPNSRQQTITFSKSKLKFNSVQCGMTKKVAAYKVQQMVADKTQVNIGDVSVTVKECSCCAATSRRLLSTGSMTAEVAILGSNAEAAGAALAAAIQDNSLSSDELGSVDAAQSEQPRMVTQEADFGNSASLAAVPSLLLLVLAVIALL